MPPIIAARASGLRLRMNMGAMVCTAGVTHPHPGRVSTPHPPGPDDRRMRFRRRKRNRAVVAVEHAWVRVLATLWLARRIWRGWRLVR